MTEYRQIESFNNNGDEIYKYAIELLNNNNKEKCKEYLLQLINLNLYNVETIVKYASLLEENNVNDTVDFYLNLLKKVKTNGIQNINDIEKFKTANRYEIIRLSELIDNRINSILSKIILEITRLINYLNNEQLYEYAILLRL